MITLCMNPHEFFQQPRCVALDVEAGIDDFGDFICAGVISGIDAQTFEVDVPGLHRFTAPDFFDGIVNSDLHRNSVYLEDTGRIRTFYTH